MTAHNALTPDIHLLQKEREPTGQKKSRFWPQISWKFGSASALYQSTITHTPCSFSASPGEQSKDEGLESTDSQPFHVDYVCVNVLSTSGLQHPPFVSIQLFFVNKLMWATCVFEQHVCVFLLLHVAHQTQEAASVCECVCVWAVILPFLPVLGRNNTMADVTQFCCTLFLLVHFLVHPVRPHRTVRGDAHIADGHVSHTHTHTTNPNKHLSKWARLWVLLTYYISNDHRQSLTENMFL